MIKRHHPLTVGEKVFDVNMMYVYHITAIDNELGIVYLSMTDEDIAENLKMFDCESQESDYETDSPEQDVYQFAEGIVDRRTEQPVCYEHNTEIGWGAEDEHEEDELFYPYYSPYLDENLFNLEVARVEYHETNVDFDLPTNELQDVITTLNAFAVDKKTPVVVEDENGRIEHMGHLWYDRERDMIRISIEGVEFVDAEN